MSVSQPEQASFVQSLLQSGKTWVRENGAWYITSIAAHVLLLGLVGLLGGAIHVAATTGEAPLLESVIDTTVPDVPIEKFDVDNAPLEVSELSTESLTITEAPAMAQEAEFFDNSDTFVDGGGGGSGVAAAADFGGLGGSFALGPGAGPGATVTGLSGRGNNDSGGSGEGGGKGFGGRGQGSREEMAGSYGGTHATERSVAGGLNWLARHQNPDGSWSFDTYHKNCKDKTCAGEPDKEGVFPGVGDSKSNPGATAMALLPYLAAGQTPESPGPYRKTILDGIRYLVRTQNPKTGALYGTGGSPMYVHGMAAIVLCEAYGMTKDNSLRLPAQRAIQFIEASQHPQQGGWRYYVAGQPPTGGDTSVVGWQLMALKSAMMAGLEVNPKTMELSKVYLKLASKGKSGGLYSYEPVGSPTPAMTAVGLLSQQFLGAKRDDPAMVEGMNYLMQYLPGKYARDSYYFYYATQVMHNIPGPQWDQWNRATRRYLIESQTKEGCAEGSWDPNKPTVDRWGKHGGRLMVTSINTLNLEVYYRFLPLYKLDRDGSTTPAKDASKLTETKSTDAKTDDAKK